MKTTTTRRAVVAGLAEGPGAGELQRLIASYRKANAEFETVCDDLSADEDEREEAHGLASIRRTWGELRDAEEAAALALCSYHCRTLDEARAKAVTILGSGLLHDPKAVDLFEAMMQSFARNAE